MKGSDKDKNQFETSGIKEFLPKEREFRKRDDSKRGAYGKLKGKAVHLKESADLRFD